jgi:hypothetical protein
MAPQFEGIVGQPQESTVVNENQVSMFVEDGVDTCNAFHVGRILEDSKRARESRYRVRCHRVGNTGKSECRSQMQKSNAGSRNHKKSNTEVECLAESNTESDTGVEIQKSECRVQEESECLRIRIQNPGNTESKCRVECLKSRNAEVGMQGVGMQSRNGKSMQGVSKESNGESNAGKSNAESECRVECRVGMQSRMQSRRQSRLQSRRQK